MKKLILGSVLATSLLFSPFTTAKHFVALAESQQTLKMAKSWDQLEAMEEVSRLCKLETDIEFQHECDVVKVWEVTRKQ